MTKLMRCIILLTVISPFSCKEVRSHPYYDVIGAISDSMHTKCIEILAYKNMSVLLWEIILETYKNVASSEMTASFYMEDYDTMKEIDEISLLSKCNKPLRLAIAQNDNQIVYEKMSRTWGISIAKPVTLIVVNSSMDEFFLKVAAPIDLVTIAAVRQSEELLELYEIYKVDSDFPLKIHKVGNWTPQTGTYFNLNKFHYEYRKFDGKVFRTLSPEIWPYVTFERLSDKNATWDGIYCRVWRELESILNFSSINHRDDIYGTLDKGSWTGSVKRVLDGEYDVVIADMSLSVDRVRVLDFIYVLPATRLLLYYKQLGNTVPWSVVFLPLNYDVWFAIFLWCLALIMCLYVSLRIDKAFRKETKKIWIPYDDFVFFTIRTFVQQGYASQCDSFSSRIIYLAADVTVVVIFVAYSAFLMSFLAQEIPRRPFSTMQGLLDDGTYKVMLQKFTYNYVYFSKTSSGLLKKIFMTLVETLDPAYYHNGTLTMLDMACKTENLLIMEKEHRMISMNPEAKGCKLESLEEGVRDILDGMAVRKGSPYAPFFKFHVQKMREAGLIQRMIKQFKPLKLEVDAVVKPISFNQVFIIFLFLLCGIIASVFLLMVEIMSASSRERRRVAIMHQFRSREIRRGRLHRLFRRR